MWVARIVTTLLGLIIFVLKGNVHWLDLDHFILKLIVCQLEAGTQLTGEQNEHTSRTTPPALNKNPNRTAVSQ